MTSKIISRALTEIEIDTYLKRGYLCVDAVFSAEELSILDLELHERWLINRNTPGLSDEQINNVHGLGADSELAKRFATDNRLLTLLEALVKPGISLFSAKLINKAPHQHNMVCHWHQDNAYWQHISESNCRLSVWIPLQDTNQHNGCLRVVPGSHLTGLRHHYPRTLRDHGMCRLSFLPGEEVLPDEISCPAKAGTVVIFDANLYHASSGNFSAQHRRAFIITYQEATARAGKHGEYKVLRKQ